MQKKSKVTQFGSILNLIVVHSTRSGNLVIVLDIELWILELTMDNNAVLQCILLRMCVSLEEL